MASQVLSGQGDVSYTNTTGQNVRVIINYVGINLNDVNNIALSDTIIVSWGPPGSLVSTSNTFPIVAFGKNLAYARSGSSISNNMVVARPGQSLNYSLSLPTEILLSPGHLFNINVLGSLNYVYNILIIPEAG